MLEECGSKETDGNLDEFEVDNDINVYQSLGDQNIVMQITQIQIIYQFHQGDASWGGAQL